MKTEDYTTTINVNATAQEAFNNINNVTSWWTENLEGSSEKLNDVFKITFGTTWKMFKIIESTPGKKVVWRVIDCFLPWNPNKTEWTGTNISFEIFETDSQTTEIRFTHLGLVPAFDCFDACSNAWGGYVQHSLRDLIDTGKGTPELKKT